MRKVILGSAVLGLALSMGAGCGMGSKTVSRATVEQQISSQLAAKVGQTPKSVSCPGDLKGEVNASMQCTLTANDGSTVPVTVTVSSVSGDTVHFDIKAGDVATPAPAPS